MRPAAHRVHRFQVKTMRRGVHIALLLAAQPAVCQDARPSYRTLEPLLARHCVICHAGDAAPQGLR